jgi:lipopolysaccharide export LptBFGC system permease protein LptF
MNRYIARLFLINVLTLLVILASFVVTVDIFINFSRFTRRAAEVFATDEGGSATGLRLAVGVVFGVWDIWGPRLLQLFNYILGVVLVTAMGFTAAQLVRRREFVALLASGVGLHRVATPFVLVALGAMVAQAVNQEVLVPRVAHLLVRDAGDSGKRSLAAFPIPLLQDDERRLFYARAYDDETRSLETLLVFERDETGAVERVIAADAASWDGGRWTLENGRAAIPQSTAPPVPVAELDTSLDPLSLKVGRLERFSQSLGWTQISRIIEHGGLDERAERSLDLARWGRIAALTSNLAAFLAAMPFFLRRLPQPMLVPCLQAAPIAIGGLVAAAAAPALSLPGLPVWLTAFLPTLLLAPIALALFSSLKT